MTPLHTITPELLAPVGSEEALIAAVRCGADAVYLGAGRFHARQASSPFDDDALSRVVAYCHARGVAVHMTLNTLVREDEFDDAIAVARGAAALGIDALIIQDRGLARAISRACPTIPLHASTQLSCHTPDGVKALMREGFSRVVLAREMSRNEIAACCDLGCEIETFVHGAQCMSVSGQCLMSAFLGGRSGNRGRCAQPCRLPFSLNGRPSDTDRALSLKDLSLATRLQDLIALGVRSFKIEGRMKRPEYVAAAVTVCRRAIDGDPIDASLSDDLQHVFSRSGFTDGYYTAHRTIDMFGSRTKDDVTAAPKAQKRLAGLYLKERAAVPVDMTLTMAPDMPLTLTLSDDTHRIVVTGEVPRRSDSPLADDRIDAALRKLGGTPLTLRRLTIDRAPTTDAPLSAFNALRRDAAEQLLTARSTPTPHPFGEIPEDTAPTVSVNTPSLVVRVASHTQLSPALTDRAALLVLPLDTDRDVLKSLCTKTAVAVEIPRGMFSASDTIRTALADAKAVGVKAAVCHNIGAVALANALSLAPVGGFGLHTTNLSTCFAHKEASLVAATASVELSLRQAAFVKRSPLPVGLFAYGRVPLMLLRNCPAKAAKGCRVCGGKSVLTDRMGAKFPLMCHGGCTDVLNSVPLFTADRLTPDLPFAFWTLYMTDETPAEAAAVGKLYADAANGIAVAAPKRGFTRGLTVKGVE